jgi:aspartate 1-decarboxylase
MLLNGPAARAGHAGDLVIVLTYVEASEEEARALRPRVILVDEKNRRRTPPSGG